MEKLRQIVREVIKIAKFDDEGNPAEVDVVPLTDKEEQRSDRTLFLNKPTPMNAHAEIPDKQRAKEKKKDVVKGRKETNLPGFKLAADTPVFYCFEPNNHLFDVINAARILNNQKKPIPENLRKELHVAKKTLDVLKGLSSNLFSKKQLKLVEDQLQYGLDNVNKYFSFLTTNDVETFKTGRKIDRGDDMYNQVRKKSFGKTVGNLFEFDFNKLYIFYLDSEDISSKFLMESAENYFKKKRKEVVTGKVAKIRFSRGEEALDIESMEASSRPDLYIAAAESVKNHMKDDKLVFNTRAEVLRDKESLEILFQYYDCFLEFENDNGEIERLDFEQGEFSVDDVLSLVDDQNFPITLGYKYYNISKSLGGMNVAKMVSKYGIEPEREYGPKRKRYGREVARDINQAIRKIGVEEPASRLLIVDDNIQSGTDYRILFQNIEKINPKCKGRMAGLVLYPLSPVFKSKEM